MAKQEKRISYHAGITRTPSDFLAQDGELAECVNLVQDGEEMKTINTPEQFMTGVTSDIVFVHHYNNTTRYILSSGGALKWGTKVSGAYTDGGTIAYRSNAKVTAIGKILIISSSGNGVEYAIWKSDGYTFYSKIPEPDVEFVLSKQSADGYVSLFNDSSFISWQTCVEDTKDIDASIFEPGVTPPVYIWVKNQESYNDLMLGLYAKQKKKIAEKKGFCLPFFVRYALELFDGSYTYISQPILMVPTSTKNVYCIANGWDGESGTFTFKTEILYLYYRSDYDYSAWADLVKGVTVFVSAPIEINNIWSDLENAPVEDGNNVTTIDRIVGNAYVSTYEKELVSSTYMFHPFKYREALEINNDIKSTSIFYKLTTIGLTGTTSVPNYEHVGWSPLASQFEARTLVNLTSQEYLKQDDYFSRCKLYANSIYAYNSRLNLANIKRGFFDGFKFFMPFDDGNLHTYNIYVRIKTDSGNRIVKQIIISGRIWGYWFYYPDPRADWVTITDTSGSSTRYVLDAALKEHPGLNGAYYFYGLPTANEFPPAASGQTLDSTSTDAELLPNQIATSEVNNPFVFPASGYNAVGTGQILALTSQTHALSQGQFGQFPLLVFCDNGIWAMEVDATGLYRSIYPMSREVCLNADSILQTDDAVVFISKKGLMMIAGRDVTCVSQALNGKAFNTNSIDCLKQSYLESKSQSYYFGAPVGAAADATSFQSFLNSAKMAYDYVNRRVLIINSSKSYCWLWNMNDMSFTKMILPETIVSVANDYPDYLLRGSTNNKAYSLYNTSREEDGYSSRKYGFLLTRPIKMGGPATVASLRELVNVGHWSQSSKVYVEVLVSDDLNNWFQITSRFGAAAKYFRIAVFAYLYPYERLSGTIITEQERRTNNLR